MSSQHRQLWPAQERKPGLPRRAANQKVRARIQLAFPARKSRALPEWCSRPQLEEPGQQVEAAAPRVASKELPDRRRRPKLKKAAQRARSAFVEGDLSASRLQQALA